MGSPCVAILGLGEAGSEIAAGLVAAGASVRGYDPLVIPGPGITPCRDEADAASGAGLVLSVNSAHDAEGALRSGIDGLACDAVWADMNTAGPAAKRSLAAIAAEHERQFADIALMSPVPGRGLHTPMLVSGSGASRANRILTGLGASLESLDGPAGLAATKKLLRSVFYKGMAAAVLEALSAARAADLEDWLYEHIGAELTAANADTVARLENGSRRHAVRREAEMAAAAALLVDLGVPSWVSQASRSWLELLQQNQS
jgi:3-hydroxyisobutyrate dehydrogenase-like beta-hydroxyacid dehydrogenase